jgi:hypothetical protein
MLRGVGRRRTAGERLREAREAAEFQLDDLAYLVRHRLPRERFSRMTAHHHQPIILDMLTSSR